MRLRRLPSTRGLTRAAIAPVAVAALIAVAGCGGEDRGSDQRADAEAVAEDPAPDAPRTYVEAGCEDELAAAARELWPEGDRSGAGSDEAAALEDEQGRAGAEASKRWPDEFAGAWGDFGETDRLYIGFTTGGDEKVAEVAEGFACPELLVAVDREHSIDDLASIQREISRDHRRTLDGELELPGMPESFGGTDISEPENAVWILFEELTDEIVATFTERYGDDLVFEEGPLPTPD